MRTFVGVEDDALIASRARLVGTHRKVMSEVLQHLAEVEKRRIHLRRGFDSLFGYCIEVLGFSEDEAYRRTEAARIGREFPLALTMLAEGTVTLSVLVLLRPKIDEQNAEELLNGVKGLTFRKAKEWLAARFPVADLPDSVRKLPNVSEASAPANMRAPVPVQSVICDPPGESSTATDVTNSGPARAATNSPPLVQPPAAREAVEPLSAERFAIKLTVSRGVRDKLELARDLARHRNPSGGLEAVLEMALDALIEDIARKKFGKAQRPRTTHVSTRAKPEKASPSSRRYVARSIRRDAVARDGLRCAHVAPDGRRCPARAFLEFDHIDPVALGGGAAPDKIRLLCRSHNRLAAEDLFGREHVSAAIRNAQEARTNASATIPQSSQGPPHR